VKFLRASIILAAALAVSVPLKFSIQRGSADADPELVGPITAFLTRHGYEPQVEQRPAGVFIYATAGACRLLVRLVPPQGWNLDSISASAANVGPLVFVFDGTLSQSPAVTASLFYDYRQRLREHFGFPQILFPLLAVAASDGCAVKSLPWQEIAEIS